MKNDYTSLYLPHDLKSELVEAARAMGYEVSCGRGSRLTEFVSVLLKEREILSQAPLIPELRTSIIRLSKMDPAQQQRACRMLELLFADGRE
jgi:hypothetical protein